MMTKVKSEIRPLHKAFGVEVLGVDLTTADVELKDELVQTFHRHGAMVVRDQKLSAEQQMAFTRRFGVPESNARRDFTYPGMAEIFIVSNKLKNGVPIGDYQAGQGWRTDASYLQ